MIQAPQMDKALKAVHNLIIQARTLAGEKSSHETIYDFLDHLEYLPALMLQSNKDTTSEFDGYLKEVCERNNLMFIYNNFKKSS